MSARALPFLVLGFGVVVVSFAAILIRFAHAEGASSLAIAAVRLGVAAAVIAPYAWLRAGGEMLRLGRRELGLCLLSGALLAVHFWAWITSLEHTSVASSTALVTTNPLWVALASAILLRERPGGTAVAGIVLTLIGSVLVFAADQLSKYWILHVLQLPAVGQVNVLPFFSLTMVWNQGVTFGLLHQNTEYGPWLLAAVSLGVVVALAIWLRRAETRLMATALGAVGGGALGNVLDRVRYGAVVDFLHLHAFGCRGMCSTWPMRRSCAGWAR